MTLRLVSDNADPRPYEELVFIDARHEAEWAQRDQSTADGWSFLAATHLACVGIGAALVALAWVIVWGWS